MNSQMATTKPDRTPEEIEDIILRKIFQVSLVEVNGINDSSVIYLKMTADEMIKETKELRLSSDCLERILIDCLSRNFLKAEPPFEYLINCYRRANEEGKTIMSMKDKSLRSHMELVVNGFKKLIASYCRIHLANPGVFFNRNASGSDIRLLLDLIFSEVSSTVEIGGSESSKKLPAVAGFLDEFFRDGDYCIMEPIFKQLYMDLRNSVVKVSALGDFQKPLRALMLLIRYPVGAKALVNHPCWIPDRKSSNGRVMEMSSILGPFFHVSVLPDHDNFKTEPDVGHQYFPDPSNNHATDILSPFTTIRTVMNNLYDGLAQVLLCLLKNSSTRKNVMEFLAEVINKNASRAGMKVDPFSCASSGFFLNLSAVMLRLCDPFLDAKLTKRDKIDPKYVVHNGNLDLRDLTALQSSSKQAFEQLSRSYPGGADDSGEKSNGDKRLLHSQDATGYGCSEGAPSLAVLSYSNQKAEYPFICECFFMTARVLHLGLLKAFSDFECLLQDISRHREDLSIVKAIHAQDPSPQSHKDILGVEEKFKSCCQERMCYEALILRDEGLLQHALSFYRLMVVWLVDVVGGLKMPLPSCPMEFSAMPEHFVEDAMDILLFCSALVPRALDGVLLDDFMNFIIIFMASPQYIKNPYLRAKMIKVLICWMPDHKSRSSATALFEGHPLALKYLVRNLLKFYVDIEFTGSHSQFYDKLDIRHDIANLLEYLWWVPGHRNSWIHIAKEEEKGIYLKFLNFLIDDSIHLLHESLNKIIQLKDLEVEMSNKAKWAQRPAHERQESTLQFQSHEKIIRFYMKLANEDVAILGFTSEQITAPLLLPEMVDRVASMLNYFLSQLVGPQRKSLSLKDPEKYNFRPKQLVKQIVRIYVQLARGDDENVFPAAIAKDEGTYNDQLFGAAADVLRRIGEEGWIIQEFLDLDTKARVATSEATDAEAALGEIPDEYIDPIQYSLMRDPVILPSSKKTVDRSVIQRHLLSANTDPFNRATLTMEMLVPDVELKSRIEEFIRSHKLEQHRKI